jgi:hypothetical protein
MNKILTLFYLQILTNSYDKVIIKWYYGISINKKRWL